MDGCKAQCAATGYSIGKRCNAADATPRPNPKGRLPAGALRCCGLLMENDYIAQPAPCTASRRQSARGMKPAEIGSYRYVAVEGPIGAGKTSLARRLAHHTGAVALLEKPEENPFLARFYQDPPRYALATQLFFLFQRGNEVRDLAQMDLFSMNTVADYLFDKDPLFARLNLVDAEFALYQQIYRALQLQAPVPDLVIYLQAAPETLLERVRRRVKVPVAYRELAIAVARDHGNAHRALELRPGTLLEVLERTDALRRPQRFAQFLLACEADHRGRSGFEQRPYPQAQRLQRAFEAARGVDVAPLVARGLSGEAMREALRAARTQAIKQAVAEPAA